MHQSSVRDMDSQGRPQGRPQGRLQGRPISPLSLWTLLGCEALPERDRRLRLRLNNDGPWLMALSPLNSYPRLLPVETVEGEMLELQPLDRAEPAARVEALDLELTWQGGEGPKGSGWISLSYKAPLWIEHLLRDLPLLAVARGLAEGRGRFGLCVGDLLLREVIPPEEQGGGGLVSCRFDLVSPEIAAFDLEPVDELPSQ
ncbi:MAG: hypothetical protein RIC87_07210 [Kiloniellales bacterium]